MDNAVLQRLERLERLASWGGVGRGGRERQEGLRDATKLLRALLEERELWQNSGSFRDADNGGSALVISRSEDQAISDAGDATDAALAEFTQGDA